MTGPRPASWLQERIDLRPAATFLARHLRKPVPRHAGFLYTLGSLALLLFLLQAATGLLMMIHYKPTVREAYDSVRTIAEDVPFGWLIRQAHVWGANLMVALVVLHMLKTFVAGAYKKPRELTWMFGVVLLGLVLGFGFTGCLLPWDQLAFWATTVGTEAPGSLPLLGPHVRSFLRGQPDVGQATLGRFFVLHVAVLPLLFLGAVAAHLLLVRIFGTAPLARTDLPEPGRDEVARAGGRPFFPDHLLKEAIAAYLLLGLLLALAVLAPLHQGPPADPFTTPEGIKPEWYFLPMFQLLKYLPEPIAVALPGLFAGLLFLLPFIDRTPERHPARRPVAMVLSAILLVVVLALGLLGALSDTTRTVLGSTYRFDARGVPHAVLPDVLSPASPGAAP